MAIAIERLHWRPFGICPTRLASMRVMSKTLLILLSAVGIAIGGLGFADLAQAAAPKKKTVVSKKSVKPISRVVRKKSKHKLASRSAAKNMAVAAADPPGAEPRLASAAVAVIDQNTGDILYEKNASAVVPIASITKLMTAMVALDAQPSLAETLTVGADDVDTLKGTHSRLKVGTQLTREEMLRLALMSSENRAAAALSRYYPGGRPAFVAAMNAKARELGLHDTRFADPTGLTAENVSSARDLVKLVDAAHQYPLIREFSTSEEYRVAVKGRAQTFRNTNALVKNDSWHIGLSKTGYISEAGKCLVMQAWFDNKPTIIVLLDSWGRLTRIGDANRIKRWIENAVLGNGAVRG
ncbi:MAG: D-alanyl-D-alanine endopeptidase [Pseudomonadota bacterium]